MYFSKNEIKTVKQNTSSMNNQLHCCNIQRYINQLRQHLKFIELFIYTYHSDSIWKHVITRPQLAGTIWKVAYAIWTKRINLVWYR